ncbi:hypothetical protein G7Y89_g14530 [Cudoniella acicularis]|uniref:Uncharacterized protein n=1 Tax=Cudoniella acicularis TaxID=354080 RepID=A0A8H4R346_9HELO|nr:hypothetical protein G7Y89_g14530 [Cudoniella acicularis]
MSSNKTPDLATVLRTLAGLAPQNPTPPQQPQSAVQDQVPPSNDQIQFQQALQQQLDRASQFSQPPPVNTAPKIVDPATILEWSAGLRSVMKTVANRENVINDIRRMIKVQHEHEEQWWKGREALIERQKERKEGQKKLDEVLKAVGGAISTGLNNDGPEELARELQTFDLKVYRAQMQMAKEMNSKLRSLGVPFFGTKTELIRPLGKDGPGGGDMPKDKPEKGIIDEIELVKLQRKMLALLEDLCGE